MDTWKENLDATKQRYIDWWNRRGLIVNMWEHFQDGVAAHADVARPADPVSLNEKWFDAEWRADYLDWYVAHSCLKADMLPVANTQLGPGSLAAILGGVFEGGEDTIWIHPDPDFKDEITFDERHPNWLLHKDLLRRCKQKAQGHYYVGMPDLMEGLDVLAALKGTDRVLMDTVMQPEVVERQMQTINDIYFNVFDQLYDIIREGDEMAFCYFSLWAPGKVTKLQSDISTMISEDDYRRFVQPFIREQCQRIDYTLYHLDGVGAIRHLPALLEISELNAIQWTPGVGEPQGGAAKWYGLYRRILEGGKSLMACWVTLDELQPLLDNIGGEGVHLEMDFHNEREVDEALRIVDDFKTAANLYPAPMPTLTDVADRILILDGAMGTMVRQYDEAADAVPDLLPLTHADIIGDIHARYLAAGADIITTDTFNAQRVSMADYDMADRCRDMNLAACRIAREQTDRQTLLTPGKSRFVAGSVGPTSKTTALSTDDNPPFPKGELAEAYLEQMEALLDGRVDAILIETIFDVENARIAIDMAEKAMTQRHRRVPIMLSFSVATTDGHNMLGQSITDFLDSIDMNKIFSVGINCLSDVGAMAPLVRTLARRYACRVSLYPNAGKPNADGTYPKMPDELLADLTPLLQDGSLNIVGGCCGTTDLHIRRVADFVNDEHCGAVVHVPMATNEHDAKADGAAEEAKNQDSEVEDLYGAIVAGQSDAAVRFTRQAISDGRDAQQLIDGEMMRAMSRIGNLFEQGKVFVPQLLMAGRAMKDALAELKLDNSSVEVGKKGRVVIGTVKGDLHDIGKNIVASMFEGCGFQVFDLGIDVSAERFVEAVKEYDAQLVGMCALLTTTMTGMKDVIAALRDAGLREKVKVIVGGAPVNADYARSIGADGYADNANEAVSVAERLLGVG